MTKFSSDGRCWVECDDSTVDICITDTDYGYEISVEGALNPLLLAAVEFCRLNMKAVGDSYDDDYDDYDDDDYDDDYDDSDDSTVMINGRRVYVPSSQR